MNFQCCGGNVNRFGRKKAIFLVKTVLLTTFKLLVVDEKKEKFWREQVTHGEEGEKPHVFDKLGLVF